MSTPPNREEEIVDAALELPAHERAAYLDKLCGHDRQLRQLVDALLHAHKKIISSQIVPPRDPSAAAGQSVAPSPEEGATQRRASAAGTIALCVTPIEKPGDQIGRYKLLEQIGEGGFGVVYVAEQREPVKRRVALKIVKLGMDTRQVVGRFEAERQALALMDHPNIAKVFDGGATEAGRPYFVMELVRGIKITDYCDQNNLPTIQRLELFIQICRAIQHAHQKGIIHRDIKPSNILVTLHDGVPVPKVIDFGIAKATQQELTERTVYTQLREFIGTPAYMSPEQAEMSGLDIDTRSDIYSLGVLLYELLTGQTPFDGEKLVAAGLDEIRRIIREQEPPRPSMRLSTMMGRELTAAAQHRQTDAPKLIHLLRGDLDWIVMKTLEKDRTRRYETVNGLAMDIERHLKCEPVMARPPSRLYEFQKTVRRHKFGFAAVGAVVVALAIGLAVSTWMFFREGQARREAETARKNEVKLRQQAQQAAGSEAEQRVRAQREAAGREQVAQFLTEMLRSVGPSVAVGRDTTLLREILDQTALRIGRDLKSQPEVEADLSTTLGQTYNELGAFAKGEEMLRKALELTKKGHPIGSLEIANAQNLLGDSLRQVNKLAEAEAMLGDALAARKKLLGSNDLDVAASLNNLALVFWNQGKLEESEKTYREVLAIYENAAGGDSEGAANTMNNLALVLAGQGKAEAAHVLYVRALVIEKKLLGENHPKVSLALDNMGQLLRDNGRLPEAEAAFKEGLRLRIKVLGYSHPWTGGSLGNLIGVLLSEQKTNEIEKLFGELLTPALKGRPESVRLLRGRAAFYAQVGRFGEAAADLAESLQIDPEDHWTWFQLAPLLVESGNPKGYRQHCQAMLARFGSSEQPVLAERTAKACLLLPATGTDLEAARRLAITAVERGEDHQWITAFQFARALAEYRAGRVESAAEWVRRILDQPVSQNCFEVEVYALEAMTLWQSNQKPGALAALSRAKAIAEAKLGRLDSGAFNWGYHDWLMADIFLREAGNLIESP